MAESSSTPGTRFDPIVGDPRLLPRILAAEVKAIGIHGRVRVIEREHGRRRLEELAATLSATAKENLLRPPLPSVWVPFGVMLEIETAMIRDLFGNDPARYAAVAATIAREDVSTMYRFLLRLGSPTTVFKRFGAAFSTRLRPGTVHVDDHSSRSAECVLRDGVVPLYFCEHGLSAWASTILSMTGTRNVKIAQRSCQHRGDPECRWRASWS
jgi:hypothetical protein